VNITHVVENLNRGGLERMVVDLAGMQQAQGHCCQVVCLYEAGTLADELREQGVPVHACGKRRGPDFRALGRARSRVREHATQVLHTHNALAHYQAVLATRGLRVQQVFNTRHGMGENRKSARREWLYRRALPATDAVVAVCRAARDAAVERGIAPAHKMRVIPNGIRVDAIEPTSQIRRERLRQSLGAGANTRLIGSVGRLNWAKDQAGMIGAFGRVHAQFPDTALVLIGDGELRTQLEHCAQSAGVAETVLFMGDRDDVHNLLPGLDLFVLSSVSEGYSMALLEACAAALPIVATDVGGNAEIVQHGRTGIVVPAQHPESLAKAMQEMLQQPGKSTACGQAARDWVLREGSLKAMAERYENLYENQATISACA
jgi:glycosyltransferase involved in cell wall biosynthesis